MPAALVGPAGNAGRGAARMLAQKRSMLLRKAMLSKLVTAKGNVWRANRARVRAS
jgi:hypothetical protein